MRRCSSLEANVRGIGSGPKGARGKLKTPGQSLLPFSEIMLGLSPTRSIVMCDSENATTTMHCSFHFGKRIKIMRWLFPYRIMKM